MGVEGQISKKKNFEQKFTLRQQTCLRIEDFPFWLVLELGHMVLVGEKLILVSFSLLFWLSLLKEGKREGK